MPWTEHDVDRWVSALAAIGISNSPERLGPIPAEAFGAVLMRTAGEQLDGLLVDAIERGLAPLDEAQLEVVVEHHTASMARALRLEQAALVAADVLDDAGVHPVLLKGCALANAVYADPARRPFGDVDLLLDPRRFSKGIRVLRSAGAVRPIPEVRTGHDAHFAKDVPLMFGGGVLDLHRTLIAGPFGRRVPVEDLLARRRTVTLGGRAMAMLDIADAYVHAGLTAGAADVPARLLTLRDMLELEAQPGFDADAVVARAQAWGAETPLARAIELLQARLRPDAAPALKGWARRHVPSATDRALMRCYLGATRSYRRQLAELAFVPTWRERAWLFRTLIMPQPTFRAARGWSRREHIARGLRKLVR